MTVTGRLEGSDRLTIKRKINTEIEILDHYASWKNPHLAFMKLAPI